MHIAIVVRDYDEALAWYTQMLNFQIIEDSYQPEQNKRWILIAPPSDGKPLGTTVLLARAATPEQEKFIGNQCGGRVFLFLSTDDFWRDYNQLVNKGVKIVREPLVAAYGTVAVFADLYGNLWDLVERS